MLGISIREAWSCTHSQGFHPPGSTARPARGSALLSIPLCRGQHGQERLGKAREKGEIRREGGEEQTLVKAEGRFGEEKGGVPQIQARKG